MGEANITLTDLRAQYLPNSIETVSEVQFEKVETSEEKIRSRLAAAEREGAVIDVEASQTMTAVTTKFPALSSSSSDGVFPNEFTSENPPPATLEDPEEADRKRKRDDAGEIALGADAAADMKHVKKEKIDDSPTVEEVSEDEEEDPLSMPTMLFDLQGETISWDQPFETHDPLVTVAVEELLASPQAQAILDVVESMRLMQGLKKAELDDTWNRTLMKAGGAAGDTTLQRQLQERNRRELAEIRSIQQSILAKAGIPLFEDISASNSGSNSSSSQTSSNFMPRGKKTIARQSAVVRAILVRKAQLDRRSSGVVIPPNTQSYEVPGSAPPANENKIIASNAAAQNKKDHRKLLALLNNAKGAKGKRGGLKKP